MKAKFGGGMVLVGIMVSTLACQGASGLLNQVGVQLEEEFGEGGNVDSNFPDDEPVGLSEYCKSLGTSRILQEVDAEGAIYPDVVMGFGGSWVKCLFESGGQGVWCDWGYVNNQETLAGCITTPDPNRNRESGDCVEYDNVTGEFCGEYDGVSITGMLSVSITQKRYVLNAEQNGVEESLEFSSSSGVMSCNVMSDRTCNGNWSVGALSGTWWIGMP